MVIPVQHNLQMESYQATVKTRSNTAHVDTCTGVTYPIIYILAHLLTQSQFCFIHCFSLLISFGLIVKSSVQGISSSCGRSLEYCHMPEIVHCIDPLLHRKRE